MMKYVSRFIKGALMGAAALSMSHVASAQFAFGGDAPIEFKADKFEYVNTLTVLTGQVEVTQELSRILSDVMTVYRVDLGDGRQGDVTKIDATGNFFYITPQEKVRGDKGVYEKKTDRIIVTGNVLLEDASGNLASGNKLVYHLSTKEAVIEGTCTGRKCPNRPSMIIQSQSSGTNN